jgi:hypothetical protein
MVDQRVLFGRFVVLLAWLLCWLPASGLAADRITVPESPFKPPERVSVLPIFFVPPDQQPPTKEDALMLMRHLEWAQRWYLEALDGRDTFEIALDHPYIYRAKRPLQHYVGQPKGMRGPAEIAELLDHFKLTRFNCPYVFLMMQATRNERPPGGRCMNGGFNTGGGSVGLATPWLKTRAGFQNTLRHELGHAFGLVHAEAYGYDQESSASVMAYNASHRTDGFNESTTPAKLIPEDIRALALNHRVFPKLKFDPQNDVPSGYALKPRVIPLPPMPAYQGPEYAIKVTTTSGERLGGKVGNVVLKRIRRNDPSIPFDPRNMWHSEELPTGWATIELTFPITVTLTGISVHTQIRGQYHIAKAVRVEAKEPDGYREVVAAELPSANEVVMFTAATSQNWRVHFRAGSSNKVAVRGLRFCCGNDEIFPLIIPQETEAPSVAGN